MNMTSDIAARVHVGALTPLRLPAVRPLEPTTRSHAVTTLKKISHVRVVATKWRPGRASVYRIDVFYQRCSASRIPVRPRRSCLDDEPTRAPDVTIERQFDDFLLLCEELCFHTHAAHAKLSQCSICHRIGTLTASSSSRPRLLTKLWKSEVDVGVQLTEFLSSLLASVQQVNAFSMERCAGREVVPVRLQRLLLGSVDGPPGN
ncbi:hypothetical protein PINS_up006380 [Pythium insidiosum]|nr:hypothetical protein PINS_up006380 [Pythium insidiosum]